MRLGDSHGGGAVFQGSGRVDAVVLDPQTAKTQLLGEFRLLVQRAPAHAQRRVGRRLLDRQQLAIAPHGRVHAVLQRFLGEVRLDVIIIVHDVQNPAAGAVGQIRDSLIFLAAAHAARTFDVFEHGLLLIQRNNIYLPPILRGCRQCIARYEDNLPCCGSHGRRRSAAKAFLNRDSSSVVSKWI